MVQKGGFKSCRIPTNFYKKLDVPVYVAIAEQAAPVQLSATLPWKNIGSFDLLKNRLSLLWYRRKTQERGSLVNYSF